MESGNIKFETVFDDINRLKAEKCRLEERLKVIRLERRQKEVHCARMFRQRQEVANLLVKRTNYLKLIQQRVMEQRNQLGALRADAAQKGNNMKMMTAEV